MQDEDFVAHAHRPDGTAGLDPLAELGIRLTQEPETAHQPRPESDAAGLLPRIRSTAAGLLAQAFPMVRR
jgi:hypothetical protein